MRPRLSSRYATIYPESGFGRVAAEDKVLFFKVAGTKRLVQLTGDLIVDFRGRTRLHVNTGTRSVEVSARA